MKSYYLAFVRFLAGTLLLLGGCVKDAEQPIPRSGQVGYNIESLKRVFLEKGYEHQLVISSKNQANTH